MKKYKAVFFDWDGTAVRSRSAPVDDIVRAMKPLLASGIKLVIISGTTYDNIAGGKLDQFFCTEERQNLFLGLARGAYNICFDELRAQHLLNGIRPNQETLLRIHQTAFDFHVYMLKAYGLETDIIFSRPYYCKVDLMPISNRGENLFFTADDLQCVNALLTAKSYKQGLNGLIKIARELGEKNELEVQVTTDAKYLEIGLATKADNTDELFGHLQNKFDIAIEDCCFWGDEFSFMDEGIPGSDAFMITKLTEKGEFFDVSEHSGRRPEQVNILGGGIERFISFLERQAAVGANCRDNA